jgi:hypothetical protein
MPSYRRVSPGRRRARFIAAVVADKRAAVHVQIKRGAIDPQTGVPQWLGQRGVAAQRIAGVVIDGRGAPTATICGGDSQATLATRCDCRNDGESNRLVSSVNGGADHRGGLHAERIVRGRRHVERLGWRRRSALRRVRPTVQSTRGRARPGSQRELNGDASE